MAEAIGLVASLAGLAFQFSHVAKEAYRVVCATDGVAKQGDLLHTKLQMEEIKFDRWAKEVGLSAETPGKFEERYKDQKMTYVVTMNILGHICEMITKYNDLERKYGFTIQRPRLDAGKEELDADDEVTVDKDLKILWSNHAQASWQRHLLVFQKRLSRMTKLKWVVSDSAKFQTLVDDLKYLNEGLWNILPRSNQATLDRSLVNYLPTGRESISTLEILWRAKAISQDYSTAALIKSMNIRADDDPSSDSHRTIAAEKISPRKLNVDRLIGDFQEGKETHKVLIEYKIINSKDKDLVKTFLERLFRLVTLLQVSPKPHGYRVLDCKGTFKDDVDSQIRWGLAFSLPAPVSRSSDPTFHTLYDLLRSERNNRPPTEFDLGSRFRLAAMLANSISYLHASGWLHRSLESKNILCFSTAGVRDIKYPYLGGFGYSRIDDPQEISEVGGDASDLYRHPDHQLQSQSSHRKKYRRSYELYSLGVILIEIGLWKQIESFSKPTFDPYSFALHLRNRVVPLLSHYMGENYRDAALLCLDSSLLKVGDDEGRSLSEAFSRKVVMALDNCQV